MKGPLKWHNQQGEKLRTFRKYKFKSTTEALKIQTSTKYLD